MSGEDLTAALVRTQFPPRDGRLTVGGLSVDGLVRRHGSPLFVYDGDLMRRRFRSLSAAVAGLAEVYYSIKANPNPAVARLFVEEGGGLEVASGFEFALARRAGCRAERILFAGPGKGAAELEFAITGGVGEIHLESFEEIETVAGIAARLGRTVEVALRINPGAAAQGGAMRMGGKPTAFGFDEELLEEAAAAVARHSVLDLGGIHLFAGTQILDADVLLGQWRYGLGLARRLAAVAGRPLKRIDLGGGLGIPYHSGDRTLDLEAVAAGVPGLAAEQADDPLIAGAAVLIEPGRWLTGPAGVYVTTVRSVKHSRGQRFVVTDGGMHHYLAASGNLGQVVKRDYPVVAASSMDEPAVGPAVVAGPLCTPLDVLGRQPHLPALAAGDLVAVLQSGAYGLSASPVGFLGHPMPAEVLVEGGADRRIREAGSFAAPLVNLPAP